MADFFDWPELDEMNLVEGARLSEAVGGTNGIGTALAADHALQVFAFEHFNERNHQWICSGAPVHDPVSGRTVGLIDLSSPWKTAHPRSLELVTAAARTMEQRLLEVRRDQDARLRRRYGDLMTRSTDLLVNHNGYVLAGDEREHSKTLDVPEDGGEVVLGDGSVAVAAPLGRGEAFLLRQGATRHAKSGPAARGLERAEERARELATEQAALRQVATLVARESSPDQLFAAVAEQVARILHVPHVRLVRYEPESSVVVGGFSEGNHEPFPIGSRWPLDSPGVIATVRQTGRPARVEDYSEMTGEVAAVVRDAEMRSAVASPIVVARRLWGAIVVLSPRDEPLPEDTEARLTDFTELVATAIANAESRTELAASEARAHQLASEQAALRRVATLVARGGRPEPVFRAVADEAVALLGCDRSVIVRFEPDGTATVLGAHGTRRDTGEHIPLDPNFVVAAVRKTGKPARLDTDDPAAEGMPEPVRAEGVRSALASPVVVDGELWGAIAVGSLRHSLPATTERRLADFTDLVATAVANAESREALARLAEEQAALRRVAVLVAQQPSPSEVFTAVTQAVGLLLDADIAVLHVFPGDGTATMIAGWSGDGGPTLPMGSRLPLDGSGVAARIFESGAPARIDSYAEAEGAAADLARSLRLRSAVGAPILVEGRLWGALTAATRGVEPWAENAETRIAAFTELVATAIANAESREELERVAAEQAALRRVATLVAQGGQPDAIFSAVGDEIGRLFGSSLTMVGRFERDPPALVAVGAGTGGEGIPVGSRWELDDLPASGQVFRTGRSVRMDEVDYSAARGPLAAIGSRLGVVSTAASPIFVEGRLWGVVSLSYDKQLPPEAEERLEKFSELIATAIGNAESSAELAASRRRIVAASDETRRRIERDLHDGTQQRLVSLGLAVRAAEANLPADRGDLRDELSRVAMGLADAVEDLQEISRGIHPAILSKGGIAPALEGLAHRSPIPVNLELTADARLPEPIEVAAYYVASEALANAAKHAQASQIEVSLASRNGSLVLSIRDDGVGGAHPGRGSGLVGLQDRVEALGGTIKIDSSAGSGTCVVVTLPIATEPDQEIENFLGPSQELGSPMSPA